MTPRTQRTSQEVVVTGVGLALPGADTPRELLRPADTPRTPRAPLEPYDTGARIGRRGHRYKDRATQLALCAALGALRDADLIRGDAEGGGDGRELTVPGVTVGVVASSNLGNLDTACLTAAAIAKESVAGLSPMGLPNASSNVIASWAAIHFGLRGPNLMLCNGATSGLDAVHWAAMLVTAGRVRRALVIGVETRNPVVEGLLHGSSDGLADGLADSSAEEPLLDGAAALVVEGAAWARDRGAAPAAVLGRYERRAELAACVEALVPGDRTPGVWFTPEGYGTPRDAEAGCRGVPTPLLETVPRHDLTAAFGRASGALGVLQCAAAVGWLGEAGAGVGAGAEALVTSGDDAADAMAALLLGPPGRPSADPRQPGGAAA
ncbi:beta-ketoacyl synthase N-terminal-like domain-containing protein [Streptomyces sp. NPDC005970]|uniref:beta-ketoacyl synthase N-terminal-like domain-containing protein n=1 Tax=Streptomyces sp. NPDC005970 TaxID=3156723 RepID=UPI00340395CB